MTRVEIHPSENGEPGTWFLPVGWKKPVLTCPSCGGTLLGDQAPHKIKKNGDVNGSIVCGHPGCNFHAFVRLLEWST